MNNERRYLITSVVAFYAIGIGIFTVDLAACQAFKGNGCEIIRGRLEGAITAAPASLLALLVKSANTEDEDAKTPRRKGSPGPNRTRPLGNKKSRREETH